MKPQIPLKFQVKAAPKVPIRRPHEATCDSCGNVEIDRFLFSPCSSCGYENFHERPVFPEESNSPKFWNAVWGITQNQTETP
jgi:hypothetical protein